MQHLGLKLRMVVVGTVLFGFYFLAALFFAAMFGVSLWIPLAFGIVLLPAIQYKLGKWLSLRSVGAEDMPEDGRYQEIHRVTESLSRDMGIEKPRLMVADMGVPNAFATGRKGAGVVVVSTELIRLLDRDELEGVIAHELAHIKNRDVITMVIGQSIATLVGYAAYFAVTAFGERSLQSIVLGWIASMIANMAVMIFVLAISRYREYVADDDARQYVGSGDPLARALEKISRGAEGRDSTLDDSVSALCIFNGETGIVQKLFATHPPVEKRIEKLRS